MLVSQSRFISFILLLFAGAYIPYIAQEIVSYQLQNPSSSLDEVHSDLKGVAIGNGAIDDAIQFGSYTEYAYSHGFIPLAAKQWIDDTYVRCNEDAASRQESDVDAEDRGEIPLTGVVVDILYLVT